MTLLRVAIGVAAFLCGVRAMGYWAILQIGGVWPAESGGISLVMGSSAFLFVILSLASAYLRERKSGARAIVVKTLFLTAAHGLPAIALFTVASRGAVLRMPTVMGLLILLVGFVLAFRPRGYPP